MQLWQVIGTAKIVSNTGTVILVVYGKNKPFGRVIGECRFEQVDSARLGRFQIARNGRIPTARDGAASQHPRNCSMRLGIFNSTSRATRQITHAYHYLLR
jgi:hypothetical protein